MPGQSTTRVVNPWNLRPLWQLLLKARRLKLGSQCLIQVPFYQQLPALVFGGKDAEGLEAWRSMKLDVDCWPILGLFAISKLYCHNEWALLPVFKVDLYLNSRLVWNSLINYLVVFLEENNCVIIILYLFNLLSLPSSSPFYQGSDWNRFQLDLDFVASRVNKIIFSRRKYILEKKRKLNIK